MKFTELLDTICYSVSRFSYAAVDALTGMIYESSTYKTIASKLESVSDFLRDEFPTYDNVVTAYQQSNEARTILHQAFLSNMVKYALPVIAYQGFVRPSCVEGSAYESYMDYPIKLIFCGMYICMSVNNAAYTMSLSKSLTKFVPGPDKDHACKCIETSRISAGFSNAFHNIGINLFVNALYVLPGVLEYITRLRAGEQAEYAGSAVGAFAYGYVLVAMKYAHHGICARHLRGLVNNNKVYCFMMGAAFLGVARGGSYALGAIAGDRDNAFIYDAVFAHLFQYFVMFNMLTAGTLKADKKAADIFYYQRMLVDSVMRSRTNKLVQRWALPVEVSSEGKQAVVTAVVVKPGYVKIAKVYLGVLAVKLMGSRSGGALPLPAEDKANPVAPPQKQSYTQIVNGYLNTAPVTYAASTTAISLLLSTHNKEIQEGLETIIDARGYPLWLVDYLPKYFTPQSLTILVKLLEQQGWEDTRLLLGSVIKIALKERARAEVAVRLYDSIQDTTQEDYMPIPRADEVKLFEMMAQIENYTPIFQESKLVGEKCLFGLFTDDYFDSATSQKKDAATQERRPRSHSWSAGVLATEPQPVASPVRVVSESDDDFELIGGDSAAAQEGNAEAFAPRLLLRSTSYDR